MNINRRKFFGTAAAATAAATLPRLKAHAAQSTLVVVPSAAVVSTNGVIVGVFSALADAQTYINSQVATTAYTVQVWPITAAGTTTPLDGSNL